MEIYNIKAKKCGNVVKIHKYKKGILRGYKVKSSAPIFRKNSDDDTPEKLERRKKNLVRLKCDFIDLINYNFKSQNLFMTLTYDKNKNHDIVKEDFKKFIKKLKYKCGKDIKYAYVKKHDTVNNKYHYHLVTNANIDITQLKKMWEHGFTHVSKIETVNSVAVYMANNVTTNDIENNQERIKLFNKSRTCSRPEWVYGKDAEKLEREIYYKSNFDIKFNKKYNSEYSGEVEIIEIITTEIDKK